MTHTIHRATLAGTMAMAFCLATFAPTALNEAAAQGIVRTQSYYDGYGAGYNSGYENAYGNYGSSRLGTGRYGYTGFGSGPYGYGPAAAYGYPSSTGYGYSSGTYNSLYYRALRLRGETYRPIYNPDAGRFYSPYGNRGY